MANIHLCKVGSPDLLLFELVEVFLVGTAAAGKLNDAAARMNIKALLDGCCNEAPGRPPDICIELDSIEKLGSNEVHRLVEAGIKVLHGLIPRRAEKTDTAAEICCRLKVILWLN